MITITIKTDNAAFDEDKHVECARILRQLAVDMTHGAIPRVLRDVNGNAVGYVEDTGD